MTDIAGRRRECKAKMGMGDDDMVCWVMNESLLMKSGKRKNLNYTITAFIVWTVFPLLGQNYELDHMGFCVYKVHSGYLLQFNIFSFSISLFFFSEVNLGIHGD